MDNGSSRAADAARCAAAALTSAAGHVSQTWVPPRRLQEDVLGAAPPGSISPLPKNVDRDPPMNDDKSLKVPEAVVTAAAAVSLNLGRQVPNARRPEEQPKKGGESVWTAAPPGLSAKSRLAVDLPESEFTYIERPWEHFVTRWAAIDVELERAADNQGITIMDLGSCNGFIALQASVAYPNATVIGVEGSVGVGNGTTGVGGNESEIIATKAVQTHLRWIERLRLPNCFIAPEVWDYNRVCHLASLGRPITHVLLSLSVIHHIDNVSHDQYTAAGLSKIDGSIDLMAKILGLAQMHFVELPDRPWIEHVHDAFSSPRAILEAAAVRSGRRWTFQGPLCISQWYGQRELWMLRAAEGAAAMPWEGLKALFPRILSPAWSQAPVSSPAPAPTFAPPPRPMAADAGQTQALPKPGQPLTREQLGAALLSAPTALLAAHLQLRDALQAAEETLQDSLATR